MRFVICCVVLAMADLQASGADSRATQIEAERQAKASQLSPEQTTRIEVHWSRYSDRLFSAYSVKTLDLELQQYVPFFNERRVNALRAKSVLTDVAAGLDTAVFVDTGKIFHRWSEWNMHNLEIAYGFGLRFNIRNSVFLRTDVGFSHAGFQSMEQIRQYILIGGAICLASAAGTQTPRSYLRELRTAAAGEYFAAEIRAENPRQKVIAHLRATPGDPEVVGIDRTW